jgi:chaperone modulatory protein CbpM
VLAPTDPQGAEWTFGGQVVVTIQAAARLRDDLELDPQTLALALTLIGRIHDLETQLRNLRAQLPRRVT